MLERNGDVGGYCVGDVGGDVNQGLNSEEHGRESRLLSGDLGLLTGDLCGDLGVLSGDRDQDLDLERQHSASSSLSTESKLLPYPPLF